MKNWVKRRERTYSNRVVDPVGRLMWGRVVERPLPPIEPKTESCLDSSVLSNDLVSGSVADRPPRPPNEVDRGGGSGGGGGKDGI
jgi:hypothetical protein